MSQIAVITPCYNSARFIQDTIGSVLRQDLTDWEYILVDDGSNDTTKDLLLETAKGDSRLKVLHQVNAGTCRARNLGAEMVSIETKYLFFLDHDDMLEPAALRILSEYLDAHPEVCVAGCQFQELDAAGVAVGTKTRSRWVPSILGIPRPLRPREFETPFATFYCATGMGPFALFRRSVFDAVGGWTTEFWPHEDTDLFCKMALAGKVHYLPDRLYRKRVHGDNGLNDYPRLVNAYSAFREKWDKFQPRNAAETATLQAAARFYRASFRPLRHVKVGTRAFGESIRYRDPAKLRWAFELWGCALRDAVRYRVKRSDSVERSG
jgi:glycosyltransferase involved in cell wall biosynthesis